MDRKGCDTALSGWVNWQKNARVTEAISLLDHISPHRIPLTIAFGEPVEGGRLASSTEFLRLIHQSLLHSLVATQHHNTPGAQVDREHGTVALADLMEGGGSGECTQPQVSTGSVPSPHRVACILPKF